MDPHHIELLGVQGLRDGCVFAVGRECLIAAHLPLTRACTERQWVDVLNGAAAAFTRSLGLPQPGVGGEAEDCL